MHTPKGLRTVRKWPGKERKQYPDARQAWQGVDRSHTPTALAYGITDDKGWLIKEKTS